VSDPDRVRAGWEDRWVQGRADPQREILDVESVAGHLLPVGGVFAFLAGHRRELFPDELFADLFATRRGRPSIPADVVASVIVLQTLHGLSDEAAAEAVTFDLRWKAACGLAVTAKGFHPTVLIAGDGVSKRAGRDRARARRPRGRERRRPVPAATRKGLHGFYGASSMERLPTERALTAAVREFADLKLS